MSDELYHYGTKRHSGRYPFGSGDDPYQHESDFYNYANELKKNGFSEKEVADACGLTVKQYRSKYSNARNEVYAARVSEAQKLKAKGYSNVAIAKKMGTNESTIRNYLKPQSTDRANKTTMTADVLKKAVDKKGYIDVGGGVENQMGVSRNVLDNSIRKLEEEGYTRHYIQTEQMGTGKKTSIMVLAKPNTSYSEVYKNRDKIEFPGYHSSDKGTSYDSGKHIL